MRVSQKKQESRIRITKLEIAIHEALLPLVPEDNDNALLDLEVLEALTNVSSRLTGNLRQAQIEDE